MTLDGLVLMLLCALPTYFVSLKVINKWIQIPILFVILITGWMLFFAVGIYAGEAAGDNSIKADYLGNGIWWSLFGVLIGRGLAQRKILKDWVKESNEQTIGGNDGTNG